jgi:hypothetical protein
MADIAWGRKDWAAALPLLEALAEAAEQAFGPRARLWQRAGWSAQMTGDVERARVNYRRAFAAEPAYLPTLLCWSQLAQAQEWWQDVRTTVPLVLAQSEAKLTDVDRAEHLQALGPSPHGVGGRQRGRGGVHAGDRVGARSARSARGAGRGQLQDGRGGTGRRSRPHRAESRAARGSHVA